MTSLRLKDLIVELELLGENNSFDDKVIIKDNKIIIIDKEDNEKDSFEVVV